MTVDISSAKLVGSSRWFALLCFAGDDRCIYPNMCRAKVKLGSVGTIRLW